MCVKKRVVHTKFDIYVFINVSVFNNLRIPCMVYDVCNAFTLTCSWILMFKFIDYYRTTSTILGWRIYSYGHQLYPSAYYSQACIKRSYLEENWDDRNCTAELWSVTNILVIFFNRIFSFIYIFQSLFVISLWKVYITVKPALRGHIWNKEKVAL
jgi:hypothetical protein